MTVHDLKDLAMIYHDCDDYKITVWEPVQQKRYNLVFTGSSNIEKKIHFNLTDDPLSDIEKRRINLLNELVFLKREINMLQNEYDKVNIEYENQKNI